MTAKAGELESGDEITAFLQISFGGIACNGVGKEFFNAAAPATAWRAFSA